MWYDCYYLYYDRGHTLSLDHVCFTELWLYYDDCTWMLTTIGVFDRPSDIGIPNPHRLYWPTRSALGLIVGLVYLRYCSVISRCHYCFRLLFGAYGGDWNTVLYWECSLRNPSLPEKGPLTRPHPYPWVFELECVITVYTVYRFWKWVTDIDFYCFINWDFLTEPPAHLSENFIFNYRLPSSR